MSKTLISFLGTGPIENQDGTKLREYRKAKYSINGEIVGESSFVSSVLMDYFEFDHIILIGTVKSMWEAVYEYYCKKNNKEFDLDEYITLADTIDSANHKTKIDELDLTIVRNVLGVNSSAVLIPYGLTRKEQIIIFKTVEQSLSRFREGDEIILDVTHSFRSLPLFTTSIINYIQSLSDKKIIFQKVYYGMLDAMREFNGIAPIIGISTAVELQNWTTAAYSFKEYGKGSLLADLLGGDSGKMIQIFSDAVNINYLNEIKTKLTNFQEFSEGELSNEFAQWVIPEVLSSFTKRLQRTGNSQWRFQYELSIWHREKENFGSAYIVLVESMVTYVCEKNNWDWGKFQSRERAKSKIKENIFGLRNSHKKANQIRNNIAHNLNRRGNKVSEDIKSLIKLQRDFLKQTKKS